MTGAPLSAQSSEPEPPSYRDAIEAAIQEYRAASYVEAREQFRRAHIIYPNARTLRGLGIAEYELHNYPASLRYLEQALASDVKPLNASIRKSTEELLERARGYVGSVRVDIDPPTARILVDGKRIQPEGGLLQLSVGEHMFEISAAGRLPQGRSLNVRGGETSTLAVSLGKAALVESSNVTARQALEGEREPTQTPVYKKWWLWSSVSVVAAGAVVGALYATRREVVYEHAAGTDKTPRGGELRF